MEFRTKPGIFTQFREPLQSELLKIWRYLMPWAIVPVRPYYDRQSKTFQLQWYRADQKQYEAFMSVDLSTGNVSFPGTVTGSASITTYGKREG